MNGRFSLTQKTRDVRFNDKPIGLGCSNKRKTRSVRVEQIDVEWQCCIFRKISKLTSRHETHSLSEPLKGSLPLIHQSEYGQSMNPLG